MAEIRSVKVYQDGVFIGEEDYYEVSDEELHQEALAAEFNDKTHQGLLDYNDWDSLKPAKKDTVLKNLLGFILYKEGML